MRRPVFVLITFVVASIVLLIFVGWNSTGSSSIWSGKWAWRKTTRPSILVVVVDRLGVNQVTCASEREESSQSGFSEFCAESVRFTHAFTTSTLSAPALGSILTGMYPFRHGLRHNGSGEFGALSSSIETAAERAFKANYRTVLISGAPPILRRTGLYQGFETFDDALQPDARRLHRPARSVVEAFRKWLEAEPSELPFFAVLHLGDMQVPWLPMPDEIGRVRESTVKGQFQEIDESLSRLWAVFKKKKRWDQTSIVVVGLQGDVEEARPSEIPALNLHSETTHVTMLIKDAAHNQASEGTGQPAYNWVPKSWSFDVNVSLADLGATLFDWIDGRDPGESATDETRKLAHSLRGALRGPNENLDEWRKQDRLILTESGWAKWAVDHQWPVRIALRKGPYLYLHDAEPTVYNTLTDAFEVSALPRRNVNTIERQSEFSAIADGLGFLRFPPIDPMVQTQERWARAFFSQRLGARTGSISKVDEQRLEILANDSELVQTWLQLKNFDLGQPPKADACAAVVLKAAQEEIKLQEDAIESEIIRACPFRGAREVARWLRSKDEDERNRLFELIYRLDQQRITATRVAEASLAVGQIWETGGTRKKGLEGLEILLSLPEAAKLKMQITRRSRTQLEP